MCHPQVPLQSEGVCLAPLLTRCSVDMAMAGDDTCVYLDGAFGLLGTGLGFIENATQTFGDLEPEL